MKPNIGMNAKDMETSRNILMGYLADVFFLYLKTHTFHFNVTGMHFAQLHELFEKQYEQLFEGIDGIGERIRILGATVTLSHAALRDLSTVPDVTAQTLSDKQMIKALLDDHESISARLRKGIETIASSDAGNADVLTGYLEEHEKNAWMLRSHLPE